MCLVPVPTFETSKVLNNNYSFKQFCRFQLLSYILAARKKKPQLPIKITDLGIRKLWAYCKFTVQCMLTFSLHLSRGLPYNPALSVCISVSSQLLNLFLFLSLPTPAWREKVKTLLLVPLSFSSSYPFLFPFSPPPLPILRRTPESGLLAELRFDDIPVDAISFSPLHQHSSRVDFTFVLDLPIRRLLTQTAILRPCPPGASLILGLLTIWTLLFQLLPVRRATAQETHSG